VEIFDEIAFENAVRNLFPLSFSLMLLLTTKHKLLKLKLQQSLSFISGTDLARQQKDTVLSTSSHK